MTPNIQFGSVYKVTINNVPDDQKPSDFANEAESYIVQNTEVDRRFPNDEYRYKEGKELYAHDHFIDRISQVSYVNGANTGRFDKANTFYFVTDDADGKDYTKYKKMYEDATENVSDGADIAWAVNPLTAVFSVFIMAGQQVKQAATAGIARLKITPGLLKMKHGKGVKELVFDGSVKDPNSKKGMFFNRQVKLVKGEL